jgi:chloramphenicol 3-O phosphotransferase
LADTVVPVSAAVVVLNGGSSSGKSSIARSLQDQLGSTWMTLGVDDLIRALPRGAYPTGDRRVIDVGRNGSVTVGEAFRQAEVAWYAGLAAIARSGTGLIVDEVFLGGRDSQDRLAVALSGLPVLWVGVHCTPAVAAARERDRPDRIAGMAEQQARLVHDGVRYDLIVDTTDTSAGKCAASIAARLSGAGH